MSELTFNKSSNNGIDFYVSNDGATTGMSLRGLTLCCGVNRNAIHNLLGLNVANKGDFSTVADVLKPFAGEYFVNCKSVANKSDITKPTIVKSSVCAVVIEYYAYRSKAKNETALKCYRSFVQFGIDGWIKQAVGYKEPVKTTDEKIDMVLKILIGQVEKTQKLEVHLSKALPIVEEYQEVKDGIKTSFKGLDTLLTCMLDADSEDLQTKNELTLSEWLLTKNIRLDYGGIRKFGRTVAETFKTCTTLTPRKVNRKKENGKWSANITVYRKEHFPILEMALEQYLKE